MLAGQLDIWYHASMSKMKSSKLPVNFRSLLWSYDFSSLDPQRDQHIIIHQVLAYGTMEDVRRLVAYYGLSTIRREFKKPQRGMYQPAVWELFRHLFRLRGLRREAYVKKIQ